MTPGRALLLAALAATGVACAGPRTLVRPEGELHPAAAPEEMPEEIAIAGEGDGWQPPAFARLPAEEGPPPRPSPRALRGEREEDAGGALVPEDAPGDGDALEPDASGEGEADQVPPRVRDAVVAAARRHLGHPFRGDCSGFVLGALRSAGISPRLPPARSRSESLARALAPVPAPRPGDLAFFHDTYDRNRDGRANDAYTHVALVEEVDGDAVVLLHRGAHGVERVRMDVAHPSDPDANDPVRFARRGERRAVKVLAGELFSGFGALPAVAR